MDITTAAISTVATVVGTTEAKRLINKEGFSIKPVIGGFILGLFLFGIGSINSDLAIRFCILIVITAILINGLDVFKLFTTVTK